MGTLAGIEAVLVILDTSQVGRDYKGVGCVFRSPTTGLLLLPSVLQESAE